MGSKIGRNDPCPCGSGQKYKRCCLPRDEAARLALAQQELFDDPDGAFEDDDVFDDDEDLDDLDDLPPFDVGTLTRVRYERGFVDTIEQLEAGTGLRATEWIAPTIPQEIIDSLEREALDELDGPWGDPDAGTPIQVDVIELHTPDDVVIVEMINRAISLIHSDNEDLKSIHRVCYLLEALSDRGVDAPLRPDPEFVPDPEDDVLPPSGPPFDWTAVTKAHRHQPGRCELCGAEVTSAGASRHAAACAPAHDSPKGDAQALVHLRVTAPGLSGYWLEIEMRAEATLKSLDDFLRHIWVDCCGHLSQFSAGGVDYVTSRSDFGFPGSFGRRTERSMSTRLRDVLRASDGTILYEYDFGSTTRLKLSVKGERTGRLGRQAMRLLARNTTLVWPCGACGEPAAVVCPYCRDDGGNPFLCAKHAKRHPCEKSEGLMPIVNSPRSGVCGYAIET